MIITKKGTMSGAEIKELYEGEIKAYTDTKDTKLVGIAEGAQVNVGVEFTPVEKNKVSNINFESTEILQLEKLATAPETPSDGDMYYDTVESVYKWWNGSSWDTVAISVLTV